MIFWLVLSRSASDRDSVTGDRKEIRGEAYRIADGEIRKVCDNGEVLALQR